MSVLYKILLFELIKKVKYILNIVKLYVVIDRVGCAFAEHNNGLADWQRLTDQSIIVFSGIEGHVTPDRNPGLRNKTKQTQR